LSNLPEHTMHTPEILDSTENRSSPAPTPTRRVTDAPTRMFHALFALSFAGAFATADSEHWRLVHVTLGYLFAGLLGFRVLYGLFGPRHARLGLLVRRLASAPAWLRALPQANSWRDIKWRQGQNLAVAGAIAVMLLLVIPLTLSGYATWAEWGDVLGGDWPEELHEFLANAFLAIVLAHVALIALLSMLRQQNQALPMLTGRIAGAGASPVKDNKAWLAALLLLAAVGFGAWQLQGAPDQGALDEAALSADAGAEQLAGGAGDDDDEDDD
jgi:cytochrome b